jgi:WD40 repeat protein
MFARIASKSTLSLAVVICLAAAGSAWAQGAPAIVWQANDGAGVVAYSRDGRLLADAGSGQIFNIRDAATGQLVRTIRDKSGINSVAFSPDASLIAEGRTNGTGSNLKVYRVSDGVLVLSLGGHQNATRSVAFSPGGTLLASGGDDRMVKLWGVSDGLLVRTISVGSRVRPIAFSPDGLTLASGDQGGSVKLWRVSDGALLRTLTGFANQVTRVAFSPDQSLIAASSLDGSARLWRVSDGSLVRVIRVPATTPNGSTTAIAFSPDGATLLTGNDEVSPSPEHGTLRFYRVSNGALVALFDQQTSVYVSSVVFSPQGGRFAYTRAIDGVLTVATVPAARAAGVSAIATESSSSEAAAPVPISLSKSRGEPFSSGTHFTLTLAQAADVEVGVYDVTGRRVATLFRGPLAAGSREFTWNGAVSGGDRARNGVYLYRAVTPGASASLKVVMLGSN